MPETRVYLVRHGCVENPEGVIYGDLPGYGLNDLGCAQAERAGRKLAALGVSAVYASPLTRAQMTAELIAGQLPTAPAVKTVPELTEAGSSIAWRGTPRVKVPLRFPLQCASWLLVPGRVSFAESAETLAARIQWAVEDIADRHPGEAVCLVSHAGPIGAWALKQRGLPLSLLAFSRPKNAEGWLYEAGKIERFRL